MHVELEGPGVAIKLTCQNSEVSKTDLSVRHYLILSRISPISEKRLFSAHIEPIVSILFHIPSKGTRQDDPTGGTTPRRTVLLSRTLAPRDRRSL